MSSIEIKIIGLGRCETRRMYQNMGLLPREGVPNICATCQANLPESECRAARGAMEFYLKNKRSDWEDGDESIAY